MTTDTLTELSQVSFFEEFLPRHMEKLNSLGSEVHFNKDEIIFRENQDSKVFYVILSGRIALEASLRALLRFDGQLVERHFAKVGRIFVVIEELLQQHRSFSSRL